MRRISIVGNSGVGKSTLGRRLAARLDVPFVELDALHHQAGWQPLPREEFRARVAAATDGAGWVVDGNYSAVRDIVWDRADTVIWLDLPRRTVMRQVVWRTTRRATFRIELWNGNRERWANLFTRVPEESIVSWAWHRHQVYRERYGAAMLDPEWSHLRFIRLRTHADGRRLLATL